jgi:hypothetical protein
MFNEEVVREIRQKCLEVLLSWEILENNEEESLVIVTNPNSKVTLSAQVDKDDDKIYGTIYKITDQTSIIRPLKARIVWRNDEDFHCEWSGFKNEEEILKSLNK